jgi:hypothetical protein
VCLKLADFSITKYSQLSAYKENVLQYKNLTAKVTKAIQTQDPVRNMTDDESGYRRMHRLWEHCKIAPTAYRSQPQEIRICRRFCRFVPCMQQYAGGRLSYTRAVDKAHRSSNQELGGCTIYGIAEMRVVGLPRRLSNPVRLERSKYLSLGGLHLSRSCTPPRELPHQPRGASPPTL